MIILYAYLVALIIAPQLWVQVILNWPMDYIFFPLMLAAVALTGRWRDLYRFQAADGLLLVFVLWIFVSAVANGWTPDSEKQVFFYFKIFVLFKFIVAILGDTDRTHRATTFFCVIAVILAVEAIQHRLSADGFGWAGQKLGWIDPGALAAGEKGRSRWVGNFGGPGVFAVLFATAVAFPICALQVCESKARRVLLLAVVGLYLWALYCTGSRGAMLAMVAVIGLALMLRADFSFRAILLSVGLAVLVYMVAPAYLTTIRDQSNSSQYRVEMWAAALDMVKGNPWFGIGIHNFASYSGRLIGHNSAVELMGETGIIGLGIWLSLLYVSVKGLIARRVDSLDPADRWYATAMLLAVTGYLVCAMFVTLEYETMYILLAWCATLNRDAARSVTFSLRDCLNVSKIMAVWLVGLQAFVILYMR